MGITVTDHRGDPEGWEGSIFQKPTIFFGGPHGIPATKPGEAKQPDQDTPLENPLQPPGK